MKRRLLSRFKKELEQSEAKGESRKEFYRRWKERYHRTSRSTFFEWIREVIDA